MALSTKHGWLIAYDIANPRRLKRIHRFLVREAIPVQYSVFYYEGSVAAMGQIMSELEKLIHQKQDDIRAYQLPAQPQIDTLGRGSSPDDACLLSSITPKLGALINSP